MRVDGSAPNPGVDSVLLKTGYGGLQAQPTRRRRAAGAADCTRVRAPEQHMEWLLETVRHDVPGPNFAGHVHDRLQTAIVAPPLHRDGDIRELRRCSFDDSDIVADLSNEDARRFLKQIELRRQHRLPDKF